MRVSPEEAVEVAGVGAQDRVRREGTFSLEKVRQGPCLITAWWERVEKVESDFSWRYPGAG